MKATVLVVEDDARVAGVLAEQLAEEGYEVTVAVSHAAAMRALAEVGPSVAIIDLMLPDGSGSELCRRIRQGGEGWDASLPILVLTARVEEADALRAFERGADDFVRKPFSMPELMARLRALLARGRRSERDVLEVGLLSIDAAGRAAHYAGRRLELAAKEYELLVELAREPGAVRTKRELLQRVWACPSHVRTRTVDSHASRLRRKLIAAGAPGDPIVNAWGLGYRLELRGA